LQEGSFVVLRVTDSGVGMSAETVEKVFEPFFTTKPVGAGTGLGLSTVHGIARRSGGGVTIESRLGHGTSASVWLPVHDRSVAVESVPPAPCVGEGRSVLLVDDEIAVGAIAARALRQAGFVVHQADGPETALDLGRRICDFDIVVSDVVMPTMSGLELVERLAALIGATPVLYVSGYAADALAARGLAADQVNLLRKPFSPGTLVRRVCAALDGAQIAAP
jgi:CheY-like chemotaxis protein